MILLEYWATDSDNRMPVKPGPCRHPTNKRPAANVAANVIESIETNLCLFVDAFIALTRSMKPPESDTSKSEPISSVKENHHTYVMNFSTRSRRAAKSGPSTGNLFEKETGWAFLCWVRKESRPVAHDTAPNWTRGTPPHSVKSRNRPRQIEDPPERHFPGRVLTRRLCLFDGAIE